MTKNKQNLSKNIFSKKINLRLILILRFIMILVKTSFYILIFNAMNTSILNCLQTVHHANKSMTAKMMMKESFKNFET